MRSTQSDYVKNGLKIVAPKGTELKAIAKAKLKQVSKALNTNAKVNGLINERMIT
jgi:3-methyladenine DNA glycosylase AlkD